MRCLNMRFLMTTSCLVLTLLIAPSVRADEAAPNDEDRAGRRAAMRQELLEEFDADGDGELSDGERSTARAAMRSRRGDQNNNAKGAKGAKGKRGKARRAKGAKGPNSAENFQGANRGRQGRRGSGGPPDPARLFDAHDANEDGQLSREEYMKLAAAVRSPRSPRGPGQRGGPRPAGPPPEGRRRFDSDAPLQNRGDRSGPPPRPEGRRRPQGEAGARGRAGRRGPQNAGRRNSGRGPGRGEGRDGFDRQGPPNPERIFEHFDADDDDQIDRDEFMKMADRMRAMRERDGHGGQRGDGPTRFGRGPRPGPAGDTGPSRRHRPLRPEADASGGSEVEAAASADDSV